MKLLILFSVLNFFVQSFGQIKVNLTQGQITGFNKQTLDCNLNVFLGIPFARPPINELRFQLPQPLNDVRNIDARKWPNPCMQAIDFEITDYLNKNFSEDCLYLNVWSPNMTGRLPVMVWIHGGGFVAGSSVEELYDGDVISAKTNTVFVSINYRLNVFGFLYAGQSSDIPGNLQFMDQVMALRWVKENIVKFGGDPNQVTIFGESSGGTSVAGHFVSPASRSLFKHAIVQSGGGNIEKLVNKEKSLSLSMSMAKTLGCVVNETEFTDEIKSCLRNLTAEELYKRGGVEATNFITITHGDEFFPKLANDLIKEGHFQPNSSLMVGTMEDEGSFYLPYLDPVRFNKTSSYNMTKAEALESLQNLCRLYIQIPANLNFDQIYQMYLASAPNKPDAIRRTVGNFFSDLSLFCGTLNFARRVYKHQTNGNISVFQYYYSYKYNQSLNETLQNLCADWMGACHSHDLYSVFGRPFKYPTQYKEREKVLAEQMLKTISHFARTGRPMPVDGVEWLPYYSVANATAMPYYEFASNDHVTGNFGMNLNQFRCQVLVYDSYL